MSSSVYECSYCKTLRLRADVWALDLSATGAGVLCGICAHNVKGMLTYVDVYVERQLGPLGPLHGQCPPCMVNNVSGQFNPFRTLDRMYMAGREKEDPVLLAQKVAQFYAQNIRPSYPQYPEWASTGVYYHYRRHLRWRGESGAPSALTDLHYALNEALEPPRGHCCKMKGCGECASCCDGWCEKCDGPWINPAHCT